MAGLLLGHCKAVGRKPADLRVVDLMAGSGYLGDSLGRLGFRQVWTVGACEEMRRGAGGARQIELRDWGDLRETQSGLT